VCDYQDDCGDNSDETFEDGLGCLEYRRTNFENPEHPLGMFTINENGSIPDESFQWVPGHGIPDSFAPGPPFDHTLFNTSGHYLHIQSDLAVSGDKAWLWSPRFTSGQTRDCRIRFFYHIHGLGVGNLTVYIRSKDGGTLIQKVRFEGSAPNMDINKWKRHEVDLASSVETEFNVIFEATVKVPGQGDIAIDDVSFTPDCKFAKDPTTTSSTTTSTTTSTSTSKTSTHSQLTTQTTKPPPPHTTTAVPTVTPAPADTGHLVTVILVVLAISLLILGLAVAAVYVYKRNVQVPGLHRIHTFVNPNYKRMGDDTNMVSLRELSSQYEQ